MKVDAINSANSCVPYKSLAAYGIGGACNTIVGNAVTKFAMYILNIGLGISPTAVGAALAIPRLYDAITDPLMGNISDRTESRWGRRKPYILAGGIASGILFILLWCFPTNWSSTAILTWFIVFSILYYTAVTIFSVPWYALGYELTDNVRERTRVMACVQIFAALSGVGLVWLIPVTQSNLFENSIVAMRWVALAIGIIIIISSLTVVIFCRSKHEIEVNSTSSRPKSNLKLFPSLYAAYQNKPFLILCGVVVSMLLGIMSVSSLTPYIIIYYLHDGDLANASVLIATNETVWQLTSFLMIPLVAWISMRFGKKRTLLVCLSSSLFGNLLKWELYSPEHPWTVVIPQFFVALSFASLWTLVNSMVADACDYSELQTKERLEGMLGGIYGWLIKLGIATAFFTAGLMLDLVGFDESLGSSQGADTLLNMRLIEMFLPTIAFTSAIALLIFYPLTEQKMTEIQKEIMSRKTKVNS